jgi:hypothetical protein
MAGEPVKRGAFNVWKYLKAAFFFGVPVPGLGNLPVNVVIAAGFAILGFGHPAFWLLGLGAETAIVCALAFNPRFQRLADSRRQLPDHDTNGHRQALISILSPDAKIRLSKLAAQCNKVLQVYAGTQTYEYIITANRDALSNLQWLYLKLLVARHYLETGSNSNGPSLQKTIDGLENELNDPNVTAALRESKTATLSIMKQRLANLQNRTRTMQEIESDLTRIEAQVDLALENASMQGKPQTISLEIDLASDLVSGTLFGESQNDIAALERTFAPRAAAPQRLPN